jgi:hypothetical protein
MEGSATLGSDSTVFGTMAFFLSIWLDDKITECALYKHIEFMQIHKTQTVATTAIMC